jgi:ABC-2 type transport system permease protein
MTGFIALQMRRSLRDVRYLIIAVGMPIGLYLLFTGLFGSHGQSAQGLPQPVELMIAMIAYSAMWAVFSAAGPRIAHERAIGWTRQLRVTSLPPATALSGKLVTALAAALPAMALVALTAMISHHVQLSAPQWLAMLGSMWADVLPPALLGLATGYLAGDDIAFPLTIALYFARGVLGGLWMPLSTMPHAMQDLGQALPSSGSAIQRRSRAGLADRERPGIDAEGGSCANSMAARQRDSRAPCLSPTQDPVSPLKRLQRPRACLSRTKERAALPWIHAIVSERIAPADAPAKAAYQGLPRVFRRCLACRAWKQLSRSPTCARGSGRRWRWTGCRSRCCRGR